MIDPLGGGARAPTPLERAVEAEHDRRRAGNEGPHQQAKQHAYIETRRPGRTAEHAVIVDEAPVSTETEAAQHARHGAHPGGEDRTAQQVLRMAPRPMAEQRREA